jgi:hypothetical protein
MLGSKIFGIGLLITGGCAPVVTTAEAPATPLNWFKPAIAMRPGPRGCLGQSRYNDEDVSTILKLRDAGESLKEVASEVGGSRQEVKCAEHSALATKRNARYVQKK